MPKIKLLYNRHPWYFYGYFKNFTLTFIYLKILNHLSLIEYFLSMSIFVFFNEVYISSKLKELEISGLWHFVAYTIPHPLEVLTPPPRGAYTPL